MYNLVVSYTTDNSAKLNCKIIGRKLFIQQHKKYVYAILSQYIYIYILYRLLPLQTLQFKKKIEFWNSILYYIFNYFSIP